MPLEWLLCAFDFVIDTNTRHDRIQYDRLLTKTADRLEAIIRDALAANDHDRIAKIVHQLCNDYAYAVHQPHARNGGLIGLAAAAIALGGVSLVWCKDKACPPSHSVSRKSPDIFAR